MLLAGKAGPPVAEEAIGLGAGVATEQRHRPEPEPFQAIADIASQIEHVPAAG